MLAPMPVSHPGPDAGLDAGQLPGPDGGGSIDAGECISGQASDLGAVTSFAAPEFVSGTSGDLNGDDRPIWWEVATPPTLVIQILFGQADGGLGAPVVFGTGYLQCEIGRPWATSMGMGLRTSSPRGAFSWCFASFDRVAGS